MPDIEHSTIDLLASTPKTKSPKFYFYTIKFSKYERAVVVQHAEAYSLSTSEFIRTCAMSPAYTSRVDPERRRILLALSRELTRQGHNLNEITEKLRASAMAPEEGRSALKLILHSLLDAQSAVRAGLAEGRTQT